MGFRSLRRRSFVITILSLLVIIFSSLNVFSGSTDAVEQTSNYSYNLLAIIMFLPVLIVGVIELYRAQKAIQLSKK